MNPFKWSHENVWKWIGLSLVIRLALFIYFNHEFHLNWRPDMLHGIVVHHNDTDGYFTPLESAVQGTGYDSPCRMPGLLPIYYPLRWFLEPNAAQVAIVIFQLMFGAVASFLLAKTAFNFSASTRVFRSVFFIYACSSFVSIWDHAAISDSLSVNLLVTSFFFLSEFHLKKKTSALLWTGLFLAWSIFFRPAHLLVFPAYAILVFASYGINWIGLKKTIVASFLFTIPFLFFDALWINHNFNRFDRFVWLQDDDQLCFGSLAPYHIAVRDMIIQRGGDFKEWSVNTELAWIMDGDSTSSYTFQEHYFTSSFPLDSFVVLKENYTVAANRQLDMKSRLDAQQRVIALAEKMKLEYKSEAIFRYYVVNRSKQIGRFIFSGNVDNLPFPAKKNMTVMEFGVKAFYTLLLHLIVLLFIMASILFIIKKNWIALSITAFPWIVILLLGGVLGYAEQRYLTPAYPFMVCATSILLFNKAPEKTGIIS